MSAEEKQIKSLMSAYKELKGSKMVLAPKHISNILKVVAENNTVYNLIAERILGYDYNGEFAMLDSGTITIDEIVSSQRVIPFVFCLLNEIDNQEREVVAVVRRFMESDTEEAFGDFCERVIYPFVNSVITELNCDTQEGKEEVDEMPLTAINNLFTKDLKERIDYIVGIISNKVNSFKKIDKDLKNDIYIIVYSIDLGLSNAEYSGILGLLSGLKRCLVPLKKFKSEIEEINVVLEAINNL